MNKSVNSPHSCADPVVGAEPEMKSSAPWPQYTSPVATGVEPEINISTPLPARKSQLVGAEPEMKSSVPWPLLRDVESVVDSISDFKSADIVILQFGFRCRK